MRICYSVSVQLEDEVTRAAFIQWIREQHAADVLAAGALDAEVLRVDGPDPICEIRYHFASRAAFEAYERDQAPRLRADGAKWLAGRSATFRRSLAEVVDTLAKV